MPASCTNPIWPQISLTFQVVKKIASKDTPGQHQPALLTVTPDIRILVAIVEELPGEQLTVFLPLVPTQGEGLLQIVSSTRVQKLESSMTDALGWILNWGVGTEDSFKPRKTSPQSPGNP
jgi:uncharacterized membrane protein